MGLGFGEGTGVRMAISRSDDGNEGQDTLGQAGHENQCHH
jgi:hypothetical protein